MEQDVERKQLITNPVSEATLLPAPIANVVSLVTRGSSLYLRLGTFIGGLALDGARVTTLTGLELSRAVIETILIRAGKDVSTRSTGELGRAEAESMLERSIATLHSTITNISFAASTGFYISTAALESATDLSQQLLGALDGILGSTDSSRAIASIVTLIRREFQNPATGQEGEKVSVSDLLMGICGLALLQRWSRKFTDKENINGVIDEVVWDIVVLDNGRRADVVGQGKTEQDVTRTGELESSIYMTARGNQVLETKELNHGADGVEEIDDMPEINLRQRIMQSLPENASVSISTSITTTKTITVEIIGTRPSQLSPPPGVEILEEDVDYIDESKALTSESQMETGIPRYRAVYRITEDKVKDFSSEEQCGFQGAQEVVNEPDNKPKSITNEQGQSSASSASPQDVILKPKVPPKHQISRSNTMSKAVLSPKEPSFPSLTQTKPEEQKANQTALRKPTSISSSMSGSDITPLNTTTGNQAPAKKKLKTERLVIKPIEKKGSFRTAFKKGSGTTLSNLWNKDPSSSDSQSKVASRPSWGANTPPAKRNLHVSSRDSNVDPTREAPHSPQRGNPNFFSSRDLGNSAENAPRSPSRASYISVHEQRRDSIVSLTDSYSIHTEGRPVSPTTYRTHLRAQSTLIRAVSEKNISNQHSPLKMHRRSKSVVPSIYTLNPNNSETSLVLAPQAPQSAFQHGENLQTMMRTGHIDGLFPQHHIVRNITRFIRFASASYGASFLRVMGIAASAVDGKSQEINSTHHHEHHSFSTHTQLPPSTILLSSFVDPQGGSDSSGHTGTGIPMVHFVSLDHSSQAVILTCRGTLGFEDVLTDLTCEYDEIRYNNKAYIVHKGIHASAKRLLTSRVLVTITAALEEFPEYGLVLCGHSLGGAVSALLAIMISSPSPTGTAFVTSNPLSQLQLPSSTNAGTPPTIQVQLPEGRPIHVYAYGPPSTLSPSLRLATRGLITTIVHSNDLVPHLSLGTLHDLQAVALAFKTDDSGAKREVRSRVWEGLCGTVKDKWAGGAGIREDTFKKDSFGEEDQWAYAALKALRASMQSRKLVPPGEVFIVESTPVLRKDAGGVGEGLGRPATRVVMRYVRDVEKRFGEVKFGGSMLLDHSPGRYEACLGVLGKGVLGS